MSLDNVSIIMASGFASIVATLVSNPFEVLKIRQQTSGLNCQHRNDVQYVYNYLKLKMEVCRPIQQQPQKYYRFSHPVVLQTTEPTNCHVSFWNRLRSMYQYVEIPQNRLLRVKIGCDCIKTDSLIDGMKYIYMKEGFKTFFNGWRYALMQATASNIFYFTFYEKSKRMLKTTNLPRERLMLPLLASGISRFLTTTITFPLDYWRVLQSSLQGYSTKKNMQLGTSIGSGYFVTVQRDVIFSCIFWILLENTKIELMKRNKLPIDGVNFISGTVAGVTTALLTLPLDVIKTRKQVSTRLDLVNQNDKLTTIEMAKQIIQNEGITGLYKGYKPRMMKVTVHAGLVYMMYEKLKSLLQVTAQV